MAVPGSSRALDVIQRLLEARRMRRRATRALRAGRSLQPALACVSLGGLLALGAAWSASCVPADPDPDPASPPDVCSSPGVFVGTWTAQVTEPSATGVYEITFTPA